MIFKDGKRCPECGGTLFEVREQDSEITIKCWKSKCKWSVTLTVNIEERDQKKE